MYVGRSPQEGALLHTYSKNIRSPSTEPHTAPSLVRKVKGKVIPIIGLCGLEGG